jgi:hypothetical protein
MAHETDAALVALETLTMDCMKRRWLLLWARQGAPPGPGRPQGAAPPCYIQEHLIFLQLISQTHAPTDLNFFQN